MVGPDRRDEEPSNELMALGFAGFLLVVLGAVASGRALASVGLVLTIFAAVFFLDRLLAR